MNVSVYFAQSSHIHLHCVLMSFNRQIKVEIAQSTVIYFFVNVSSIHRRSLPLISHPRLFQLHRCPWMADAGDKTMMAGHATVFTGIVAVTGTWGQSRLPLSQLWALTTLGKISHRRSLHSNPFPHKHKQVHVNLGRIKVCVSPSSFSFPPQRLSSACLLAQ